MHIKRMIVSAFVRRIVYVVVAASLAWAATTFEASAQAVDCSSSVVCTQGQAYTAAIQLADQKGPAACVLQGGSTTTYTGHNVVIGGSGAPNGYVARIKCSNGSTTSNVGETYFDSTKKCSARPAYNAGIVGGVSSTAIVCDGGCAMKPAANNIIRLDKRDSSIFAATGTYSPTGGVCNSVSNDPLIPERKPLQDEFCTTLEGGGYQLCPQKDGKTCVKSNRTGRKYCGNNDYPTASVSPDRTEGAGISAKLPAPGVPAPIPTARPGETWTTDSTASVTSTTTNNVTNVTNVNNSGTPNTTPGSEQPGDGSDNPGTPGDGSGGDEGEGPDNGTVTGGGSCETPPAISGGDPVANFATLTLWKLDCSSKADQGDLDQAASDADAMANCSLNGIGCDDLPGTLGEEPGEGTAALGPDEDPLQGSRFSKSLEDIELDDSGFLAGSSCPTVSNVSVGSMSFPISLGPICDVLNNVSGFIMALAYFIGFGIIARGFN